MKESVIAICIAVVFLFIVRSAVKEGAQRRYVECVMAADTPARGEFCKEILK